MTTDMWETVHDIDGERLTKKTTRRGLFITYHDDEGRMHRTGGPAEQSFFPSGAPKERVWRTHGAHDREGGPSRQEWFENRQRRLEEWTQSGMLMREVGPARQSWHPNGQQKSVQFSSEKSHCEDRNLPVIQRWNEDGVLISCEYDRFSETKGTGPSHETSHTNGQLKTQEWFAFVKADYVLHRVDGPAYQRWDESGKLVESTYSYRGEPVEGKQLRDAISPNTSARRLTAIVLNGPKKVKPFALSNPNCPDEAKVAWALMASDR